MVSPIAGKEATLTNSRHQALRLVSTIEEDQGHVRKKGRGESLGRCRVIRLSSDISICCSTRIAFIARYMYNCQVYLGRLP
jgi:hypothetical protein